MIEPGSTIILRTKEAIYATCKILAMNKDNIRIAYFTSIQKDRKTGKSCGNNVVETIPLKNIVSMSERLQ